MKTSVATGSSQEESENGMSHISQGLHPVKKERTRRAMVQTKPCQAVQSPRPPEIGAASVGNGPRQSPATAASADGFAGCFWSPSWNHPPPHPPSVRISRSNVCIPVTDSIDPHATNPLEEGPCSWSAGILSNNCFFQQPCAVASLGPVWRSQDLGFRTRKGPLQYS